MSDFNSDMKFSHAASLFREANLPSPQEVFDRLKLALSDPQLIKLGEAEYVIATLFTAGVYAEIEFENKYPNRLRLK